MVFWLLGRSGLRVHWKWLAFNAVALDSWRRRWTGLVIVLFFGIAGKLAIDWLSKSDTNRQRETLERGIDGFNDGQRAKELTK